MPEPNEGGLFGQRTARRYSYILLVNLLIFLSPFCLADCSTGYIGMVTKTVTGEGEALLGRGGLQMRTLAPTLKTAKRSPPSKRNTLPVLEALQSWSGTIVIGRARRLLQQGVRDNGG